MVMHKAKARHKTKERHCLALAKIKPSEWEIWIEVDIFAYILWSLLFVSCFVLCSAQLSVGITSDQPASQPSSNLQENCLALDNSQTSHSRLFCMIFAIRNDGIYLSHTFSIHNVSYCHSGHCVSNVIFFLTLSSPLFGAISKIKYRREKKKKKHQQNSVSHGYNGYNTASVLVYLDTLPIVQIGTC